MTQLDLWKSDPDKVRAWKAAIAAPIIQEGLNLLLSLNLPTEGFDIPKGVSYTEYTFGEKKRLDGFFEFYRSFVALGMVAPTPREELPADWEKPTAANMPEALTPPE